MGLQVEPAWLAQNLDTTNFQHPIELGRQMLASEYGRRSGVLQYGDLAITSPGSGMTVDIAAGAAFLQGVESNLQGGYFAWLNAADSVNFGAASATTRYDSIILRVEDQQYGSIPGDPGAYFEVVAGDPATSVPRADAYFNAAGAAYVPGAWFRLADIKINPGDAFIAANNIFPSYNYVSGPGGIILCSSTNRPAGAVGRTIYEVDTGLHYYYDATDAVYRMLRPYKKVQELTSAAASITFSGIPRTLRTIRVTISGRTTQATVISSFTMQLAGDTGSLYNFGLIVGTNTTVAPQSAAASSAASVGVLPGASATANIFGSGEILFTGWNSPTGHTTGAQWTARSGFAAGTLTNHEEIIASGAYTGVGSLTSIKILSGSGNFVAGTTITLEGWD